MESTNRTIRLQSTVSARWLHVRSVAVGVIPAGRGTPDLYALIARASAPELRVDIHADGTQQTYVYQQALFFDDIVAIGFGNQVHLIPLSEGAPRTLQLNSYFVSLHRQAESIYVVSGEDVTRLDLAGDVIWTSPQLAIDGIRLELIDDEVISGEAEHHPPGDWRPFRIRVSDGQPI